VKKQRDIYILMVDKKAKALMNLAAWQSRLFTSGTLA
jgi:hypothetical protein